MDPRIGGFRVLVLQDHVAASLTDRLVAHSLQCPKNVFSGEVSRHHGYSSNQGASGTVAVSASSARTSSVSSMASSRFSSAAARVAPG